jgi:methionyl-tRNA synthetase
MSWGVPVPGDEDHVMYVWFDALVNYISTLGWPDESLDGAFNTFWKEGYTVQYCGKDNLRQQSGMWQAMLMAAGLPPTKQIVINGFFTGDGGIKMSKSLGNVINPLEVVEQYSADALRFFCLSEVSSFEDSPFTMDRFKDSYNAKLANGIGNLTSRIMKMAETHLEAPVSIDDEGQHALSEEYLAMFDSYDFAKVCQYIWSHIQELDALIQDKKPFALVKINKEDGLAVITELVHKLYAIAKMLTPLMPQTASAIRICIKANKVPSQPLFIRHE